MKSSDPLACLYIVLFLAVLPSVVGYGYAAAFFYAYESGCFEKSKPFTEDNYRVFLLNRGCTLEDAAKDLARDYGKTPERILALYRGDAAPASADETLIRDTVRNDLTRSFKPFEEQKVVRDDPFVRLVNQASGLYLGYATPLFYDGLDMGAQHMAAVVGAGPLAKGILFVAYALGAAFIINLLWGFVKRI